HLECSVMAHDLLGRETNGVIDIHSGGEDNLFPHHECEIAQSCGASGEDYFARYWFHPRHLFVEGEKMSKSKGTFFTVEQLLDKGFSPAAIRLELIKTHYRSNANFTMQGLRDSAKMVKRWRDARIEIARRSTGWKDKDNRIVAHRLNHSLERAMNDDLNIAGAIGTINGFINTAMTWETHFDAPEPTREEAVKRIELAKAVPPAGADGFVDVFSWIGPVLGVFDVEHEALAASDVDESKIEALIAERAAVRKAKDWTRADAIRDELDAMGIELVDTSQGTTWKHKTPN
ncbi:MAG: hypothetical protein KAS72_08645, partial [Phycisphaerales bacterium]|nr:hypothetical protein [Phycisphaerales bacterium]